MIWLLRGAAPVTDENKLFICFICSHVTALKNAMPFFKTSFRELPSQDCIVCNNCPEELILFQARSEGQAAALSQEQTQAAELWGLSWDSKGCGKNWGSSKSLEGRRNVISALSFYLLTFSPSNPHSKALPQVSSAFPRHLSQGPSSE